VSTLRYCEESKVLWSTLRYCEYVRRVRSALPEGWAVVFRFAAKARRADQAAAAAPRNEHRGPSAASPARLGPLRTQPSSARLGRGAQNSTTRGGATDNRTPGGQHARFGQTAAPGLVTSAPGSHENAPSRAMPCRGWLSRATPCVQGVEDLYDAMFEDEDSTKLQASAAAFPCLALPSLPFPSLPFPSFPFSGRGVPFGPRPHARPHLRRDLRSPNQRPALRGIAWRPPQRLSSRMGACELRKIRALVFEESTTTDNRTDGAAAAAARRFRLTRYSRGTRGGTRGGYSRGTRGGTATAPLRLRAGAAWH
jgi:hypothetical protein